MMLGMGLKEESCKMWELSRVFNVLENDCLLIYFRMGGEEAEIRFCEHKRLNMATLRMTWEAKVQLKEILINSGFPEGRTLTL